MSIALSPEIESAEQFDAAQIEVSRVRALRGPNYWRLAPVIACDMRLGGAGHITTAAVPGFTDRLLDAMPSLRLRPCSRERPGGLVERLLEGTSRPHVLAQSSLELHSLA